MVPDRAESGPREILQEPIDQGTEAFQGVLEKLFNEAMKAEPWERNAARRGWVNGCKDKRIATRAGELTLKIPQARGLSFYRQSLEKGCRSEKALKLAIAEMYVKGVSTRKVTEVTERLCGLEVSASQVSRVAKLLEGELENFRPRELGSFRVVFLDAHYKGPRGRAGSRPGHFEGLRSEPLGPTRGAGGKRRSLRGPLEALSRGSSRTRAPPAWK